ncbi:MAG: ergothioneine biosynthesis protein EgtB [bacterium]|nr:ergothioneine biosynthesis protein EgtB [bacterium]
MAVDEIYYTGVRSVARRLTDGLEPEDMTVQVMSDASPTKWHLAHTTWFFEQFILRQFVDGYKPYDDIFLYLFNSYYNRVGTQFPRAQRGLITRPTTAEVFAYREHVDRYMCELLHHEPISKVVQLTEIGLHHEQQHQELILTDLLALLAINPMYPEYRPAKPVKPSSAPAMGWSAITAGEYKVGCSDEHFAYDNERPSHRLVMNRDCLLATRPVTVGEYLEFMTDAGYARPELWLSEGWNMVQERKLVAPRYWEKEGDLWRVFTLSGRRPIDEHEPVCHVSYFEADAYARWAGYRLPTEFEWEIKARDTPIEGNFMDSERYHPIPAPADSSSDCFAALFGDVWEWTQSSYQAYPGFRSTDDALGEYNGKFMCNQYVLRGGSCLTSRLHMRSTYRNFWPAYTRFQMTGIRLAKDG